MGVAAGKPSEDRQVFPVIPGRQPIAGPQWHPLGRQHIQNQPGSHQGRRWRIRVLGCWPVVHYSIIHLGVPKIRLPTKCASATGSDAPIGDDKIDQVFALCFGICLQVRHSLGIVDDYGMGAPRYKRPLTAKAISIGIRSQSLLTSARAAMTYLLSSPFERVSATARCEDQTVEIVSNAVERPTLRELTDLVSVALAEDHDVDRAVLAVLERDPSAVQAIKALRASTGMGLAAAKVIVDRNLPRHVQETDER